MLIYTYYPKLKVVYALYICVYIPVTPVTPITISMQLVGITRFLGVTGFEKIPVTVTGFPVTPLVK